MAEKKQKKRGRPFLPQSRVKLDSITVRLEPGEKATFERAAQKAGIKLSEWIRRALKIVLDKNIVLM